MKCIIIKYEKNSNYYELSKLLIIIILNKLCRKHFCNLDVLWLLLPGVHDIIVDFEFLGQLYKLDG